MSLREDLDRLAGECEACATRDGESIDYHMIACPSCVDHRLKAEQIDGQVREVRNLSTLPEGERRHVVGYDINDFLNMSETQRLDAMKDMFENTSDLDEEMRTKVIKTRTDLMTSLPKKERETLIKTARTVYEGYDQERLESERRVIDHVTADYNPLKRTVVRRMYKQMMS